MRKMSTDHTSLSLADFRQFVLRNLEPGARFLREDGAEGEGFVRTSDTALRGGGRWHPVTEAGLAPALLHHDIVVEAVADGQVLLSFPESSYISYGFAAPAKRLRGRRRRRAVVESVEGIKDQIRGNRALLRHFVILSDEYRKDPQLSSKEAEAAMKCLMRGLYDSGSGDIATAFGAVEFEPDPLAWVSLMDAVGEQTLAQFLGIQSVAELPGADLDQRVDDVMGSVDQASQPVDDDAAKLLASTVRRSTVNERVRRAAVAGNHMAHYYRR